MKTFRVLRTFLIITAFVYFISAEEGNTEDEIRNEGEEFGEYIWQKRLAAFIIFTILVFLSILFELGREKIEETTSEELKPVVEQLFQGNLVTTKTPIGKLILRKNSIELTVLGFLSFLTFLLVQFGSSANNPVSEAIFHEEELLSELIEFIHMGLFVVIIVYIFEVILLIRLGEFEKKKWANKENLVINHKERVLFNYEKALQKKGRGQDKCIWKILPFLNPTGYAEENMNYMAIRNEFISPRDKTQSKLPSDFRFK